MVITALYVHKNSIYKKSKEIDPWDEERDARKYKGKNPVIAHPPCNLWCKMAIINHKRWGGEHNRPGNDGGCFASALANVERCGGVLEHPAQSLAWNAHGLATPIGIGWIKWKMGYICEVWQSAYGLPAAKATWLYYVGIKKPFNLNWNRPRGEMQIGYTDRKRDTNKPTLGKRKASDTPELFMNELIRLAKFSKEVR